MEADLDRLDASALERMVNDLLFAATRPFGRYSPNATPPGVTDGGRDGAYEGPWPLGQHGELRSWKVSIKRIERRATRRQEVDQLKRNLGPELDPRATDPLLVVTNVDLQGTLRSDFERWLDGRASGSRVVSRAALVTLLDQHPYVARHWRLGGLVGSLAFQLPREPGLPAPPTAPGDIVDQVARALDAGCRALDIVAPPGFAQAEIAQSLAWGLRVREGLPPSVRRRVPLLVVAGSEGEVDRALGDAIVRLGQQPYVFIVPPGTVADAGVHIAARLRREDGTLEECATVAFLTEAESTAARRRTRGGGRVERIELGAVDAQRIERWLREVAALRSWHVRPGHLHGLATACAGRPGDALAVAARGGEGLEVVYGPWSKVGGGGGRRR